MSIIVQKYGGTSVGSVERIQAVAERVRGYRDAGHQVLVVVSAMSGETNRLESLGRSIAERPAAREMDVLLSSGEQVTVALLAMALTASGCAAKSYLGDQIRIRTDGNFGRARIRDIDTDRLQADIDAGITPVIAGFQGVDEEGNLTTLGRGGSDTTAVAIAAALGVDECEICTDVDGVYTADPRIVDDARRLDEITFEEMLELASLGSKVLHPRSVEFAGKYRVPLRVLSSFEKGPGTLITTENTAMEQPIVSGIAYARDEAKITMSGVPDIPGIASRILGPVARALIEVDMIVQNTSEEGITDLTFTVIKPDFYKSMKLLSDVAEEIGAEKVLGDENIAKVSIIGVGMKTHAGVAQKMFQTLADENVNILMISTSEIKVSCVIEEKYTELAVRVLHEAFNLEQKETEA